MQIAQLVYAENFFRGGGGGSGGGGIQLYREICETAFSNTAHENALTLKRTGVGKVNAF